MEFVFGRFSHFYIVTAYSNYILWRLNSKFCKFTQTFSKTSTPQGGACSVGVAGLGGAWSQGGAWSGGGLVKGGAWWRLPRDGHCSGRYASYWNAFLLFNVKMLPTQIFLLDNQRKSTLCQETKVFQYHVPQNMDNLDIQ